MRHIIPISGKDSLCTALVQIESNPDIDYEFMFNPTGSELPEVFEWLDKVEKYLGKTIVKVGENLRYIIEYEFNWFLPSQSARYCTRMSKIEPMEKYIGKDDCTVYYGIRADEDRGGYNNKTKPNIHPVYPLKEKGITIEDVYRINAQYNLKPPVFFWEEVYIRVCRLVGEDYVRNTFKEWEIDALFAWRTRANCAHCYNQRQYEWVGLATFHSDLFEEYTSWENNVSTFYFAGKDKPLSWILENKEKIINRRVNELVKFIEKTKQMKFEFENDEGFIDMLSITSCGLLCGK